jgi:ABC-type glycerol-3-phosphate transport system substrate-binding protein
MEKYNLDMNEYHPAFRMHATGPNGEALGLISDADMWAFCVRKNLLEKAGIDKIPDTWEDVLYAIESLKPIGEKEGWYPFDAIYNAKGFCCYLSWNEIAFQWEDYKVVKPDSWEPDFIGSNGGGIEALKVYKKLIEASPPGALSYEYPDGREQWLSGNAAMEVGWTCLPHIAMYPEVSKISPLNTDNILEVGPVPKATARRSCGVWVTTAAGIEKAAKNPELAFLFTIYMLSQESMTIAMLQGPSENHVGFKQVLADERVTNVSIGMKNTYKWAHTTWTTPYAQLPEHYEIGEAVGAEIYRYLDGSVKDPEVALKNAEDAARKILERGGYLKPGTPPPEPYNLKDWCKKHNIELPPPP